MTDLRPTLASRKTTEAVVGGWWGGCLAIFLFGALVKAVTRPMCSLLALSGYNNGKIKVKGHHTGMP